MPQIGPITDFENARIDDAIAEAEVEYRVGAELIDAKEIISSLKRKHLE